MRRIALSIISLIILIIPVKIYSEAVNGYLADNSKVGFLFDVCPWQDGLAVLGTSGIWKYQPETDELYSVLLFSDMEQSLIKGSDRPDHLFSINETLYVYSGKTCTFFKVTNNTLEHCLDGSQEISVYDDQGDVLQKQFISGINTDDGIYILLKSITFTDGWIWEMYYLNPETDSIIDLGKQDIDILYSYTNGKLLAGKKNEDRTEQMLYLLDNESGIFNLLNDNTYNPDTVGFVWDGEKLSYLEEGGHLISEIDNTKKTIAHIPYEYLFNSSRAFLWNNAYVYIQDGVINIRDLSTNSDEFVILKILGHVSDDIVRQYMAENPGISIVFDPREDTFLGLQETLISKDNSVDLFLVASDGAYEEIVNKGYAAPLTASDHLMKRISVYYSWVRDLLFQNNDLYAIPVNIYSEYWTINRSMWNKLNLGDYPHTFADIYRIMELWNDNYADDYPEYSLFESTDGLSGMLRIIIQQYLLIHEDWSSPVIFDSDEFRTALQDVLDHSDMFDYDGEILPLIMNYPQYLGTGYNDADIVESFIPPALTPDSAQAVRSVMDVLMLNPFTEHHQEAIDFMEYYVDHLDLMTTYQIDASCSEPLRYNNYEENIENLTMQIDSIHSALEQTDDPEEQATLNEKLKMAQTRLVDAESEWLYSPEDIEIYHKIAQKIIIPTHTIYPYNSSDDADVFDNLIDRFMEGHISQEEFITILNNKSMIIFAEEQ